MNTWEKEATYSIQEATGCASEILSSTLHIWAILPSVHGLCPERKREYGVHGNPAVYKNIFLFTPFMSVSKMFRKVLINYRKEFDSQQSESIQPESSQVSAPAVAGSASERPAQLDLVRCCASAVNAMQAIVSRKKDGTWEHLEPRGTYSSLTGRLLFFRSIFSANHGASIPLPDRIINHKVCNYQKARESQAPSQGTIRSIGERLQVGIKVVQESVASSAVRHTGRAEVLNTLHKQTKQLPLSKNSFPKSK